MAVSNRVISILSIVVQVTLPDSRKHNIDSQSREAVHPVGGILGYSEMVMEQPGWSCDPQGTQTVQGSKKSCEGRVAIARMSLSNRESSCTRCLN